MGHLDEQQPEGVKSHEFEAAQGIVFESWIQDVSLSQHMLNTVTPAPAVLLATEYLNKQRQDSLQAFIIQKLQHQTKQDSPSQKSNLLPTKKERLSQQSNLRAKYNSPLQQTNV